ncbi:Gag-pro-like protein [Cucumis melo var. makuwa]|uniref:Gag-pro-like protein n=1 Tax=Cucumis melo var. makuwa TaxID=1194695 RepID=A0A5A7UPX2_CUCMM|nr:Gag-pro-like protein [Cucumis melo var. makuwa]TYK09899.1 Gag-pro-like protein [Cucumis melo var. makuwa]
MPHEYSVVSTTQHYVATNLLYAVPPHVRDIEQLEAQAKIQNMGQNENTPTKKKLDVLEERLRGIEGPDVDGNLDATQLCLVPGLIIPATFKVSKFDKYDGSSCPRSHLIMYCRKMAAHINNDKLLILCFQDSLSGPASQWRLAEVTTEYGGIKKGTISKKKEGDIHAIGFPNSGKHKSIFG